VNALLRGRDLVKDFPGVRALDGVGFEVRGGRIHALVGENGAGKSTLIKILAGVHPHGSFGGELLLDERPARFGSPRDAEAAGLAVIHQELALAPNLSVGENILLGDEPGRFGTVDWHRLHRAAAEALERVGLALDPRTPVDRLGVGAQQLVEIAKAVRKRSRALILDEPTAALSAQEVQGLMRILRGLRDAGTAIVYISHRLDEVFQIADQITVLRDGRTVRSAPAAEFPRPEVVRAMVGRELSEFFPKTPRPPGQTLLELDGLSVAHPFRRGRLLLDDVSLRLRAGEVLGIAGLMGAGRTALLTTLFGRPPGPVVAGRLRVGGHDARIRTPREAIGAGLALVPEDRKRQGLALMLELLDNMSMAHLGAFSPFGVVDNVRRTARCRQIAAELDVRAPSLRAAAATLSGGNQQKVVLAKWLIEPPRVFLLDEPTRGIDVGAKTEIYRWINELTARGVGIVMASSELDEVLNLSDRILVLRAGRVGGEFARADATPERIMEQAT
jgi:ABC-type sugar transport system ATPase subunit